MLIQINNAVGNMNDLVFSLNATVPVFIVIIIGYILKKIGFLNEEFIKVANRFNFKVTLPMLLIQDLIRIYPGLLQRKRCSSRFRFCS